ncbi:hypothetical protein GCM10010466_49260 [Planomonospora alba]|uniref:Integral membrane protein n=1 Tax=Planomonospora alba TaxID=161354 RepID=A0ABP6NLM7_9ACTN
MADAVSRSRVQTGGVQNSNDIRQDMHATLHARRELGPEYEAALVESLVERIDATIAARVQAELHAAGAAPYSPYGPSPYAPPQPKPKGNGSVAVALGSLGIGIPLTAVAAAEAGAGGLLLAWAGIVAVNLAHSLGRLRHRH